MLQDLDASAQPFNLTGLSFFSAQEIAIVADRCLDEGRFCLASKLSTLLDDLQRC
jgi:hypothetical protein